MLRRTWRWLTRFWQEAGPEPAPSIALAVGSWECGCGLFKVAGLRSPDVVSVRVCCPYCHDSAEVLAAPA